MESDRRKARVKRLKREILVFIGLIIVIPWFLTIYLAARNTSYKKNIAEKEQLLGDYLEQLETLTSMSEEISAEHLIEADSSDREYRYEDMTPEEIAALSLSDEELYDGYRKVYLTFDDGPSTYTDAILDILKQYDVKATFFVIYKEGRDNEALYRRIVDEGHTLGMHSCTHVYSKVYAGEDEFREDTQTLRDYLYMVTGVESEFYRFPGGSSNKASDIDIRIFGKILEDQGIEYFDWNMSSGDAHSPILPADSIFYQSTNDIESFSQAVILFHDTASKTTTVEALPGIIEYIQSLDHTVILPITKETNPVQHVPVNKK